MILADYFQIIDQSAVFICERLFLDPSDFGLYDITDPFLLTFNCWYNFSDAVFSAALVLINSVFILTLKKNPATLLFDSSKIC
jgi:hypothetical protein